ncbi:hypothetical protein KSP39_PZI020698 [Platanthera zijinensis]|uniref:O-fucosyltransferase family protein n=1 Tax=Platanthera zijinensis TaxID=2320716 RepID=A0AAP0AZF4_9ASPA
MKRRPLSVLVALRRLLAYAVAIFCLVSLLSFNVLPPSRVPAALPDAFKLLKPPQNGFRSRGGELRWMQELSPPRRPSHMKFNSADSMNGDSDFKQLWMTPSSHDFVQCVWPSPSYSPPGESRGYLVVHTNGGLNQMRAGICDMVAVARIINATLVIPKLDKRSFWQDSSNFSNVFDEGHFIRALANDVHIVKKLPKELQTTPKALKHFVSWSKMEYYQAEIYSLWDDYKVIQAAKSDSRLANNNLPLDIQRLRCRAFYDALRFAPHIESLGKLLVERMRSLGRYIALHLRYEKDMLAFTGCTYGLSTSEADELTKIRDSTSYWRVKDIDSQGQRIKGYCPLTPKEVGIFLSALGYSFKTPIYIASGEIYGGDSQMADLRARFPLLMSKETIASAAELEPFVHHASQMAALDYIVSVESDVFVPSYSGNMARAVAGHRRFLGHRKTVTPDRKALVHLFSMMDQGRLREGHNFSTIVTEIHRRRQGSPRKRKGPVSGTRGKDRFRSEEAFYENPLPDCLCRQGSSGAADPFAAV